MATLDPGPDLDLESLVDYKSIVKKYQEQIYRDEYPGSESSDEHF